MGTEEKKEYLKGYYYRTLEAKRISDRIDELRALQTGSAIRYSDMPKAHNTEHDLSDDLIKIDNEVTRLIKKKAQAIKEYKEIERAIETVEDEKERAVLKYRYLDCMKWEEIAVTMSYTFRYVTMLHGIALQHFEIP